MNSERTEFSSSFSELLALFDRLDELLYEYCRNLPTDRNHLAAGACLHFTHEHVRSVALLAEKQSYASASALLRPCVEGIARHMWLLHCIDEGEVLKVLKRDKGFPNVDDVVSAMNKIDDAEHYVDLLEKLWTGAKGLHSLTHGGALQILRRVERNGQGFALTISIEDEEISSLIDWVGKLLVSLVSLWMDYVDKEEFRWKAAKLLEETPTSRGRLRDLGITVESLFD